VPKFEDSIACVAFYSSKAWQLHCDPGLDRWPWDNLVDYIGSRCLGEANDVFNGMGTVTYCRLTMSLACTTRHWVVGSLGTIAARLPRVVEPSRTVAIHCEWAAGLHCTVTVLQSPC
jgi:hypothetical protein